MSRYFYTVKPRFWIMLFCLLAIVCTIAYSSQQNYIDRQQDTLTALEAERDAAIEANAALQRKIDFTYTDEYIEREARSRLGLVMEGEILFEAND